MCAVCVGAVVTGSWVNMGIQEGTHLSEGKDLDGEF